MCWAMQTLIQPSDLSCLGFFWYALMKEICSAGARSAKVQNQYATHGRYEEFINKFLHAVTSGASALAGAQVLQEHCSV